MERTLGATVGLLLLSAAVLPVPATGVDAGVSPGDLRPVDGNGGSVVAPGADRLRAVEGSTAGDGDTARETAASRPLALPDVEWNGIAGIAVLAGLLGLVLVGAALIRRRTSGSTVERSSAGSGRDSVADDVGRSPGTSSTAGRTTEPAAVGTASEGLPPTVRTDEETVLYVLIANSGRMRQARIVEETGWSKAKVSRVLSRMEEQGRIVRERDGREKVVQLADANSSVPL